MRIAIAVIMILLSAGCGSGPVMVADDPVQDSLDGVKQCLSEAIESVQAITAPPPPTGEEGEGADTVAPLPGALGALVRAAQDLVNESSGKPIDSDAKAILSNAKELERKANDPSSAREIESGLQQLLSRVNDLRMKR